MLRQWTVQKLNNVDENHLLLLDRATKNVPTKSEVGYKIQSELGNA